MALITMHVSIEGGNTMPKAGCVQDLAGIHRAAQLLGSSLHWAMTPDGHDFWSDVTHRLTEWANGADPKHSLADSGNTGMMQKIVARQQERIQELEGRVLERDEKIQKLGAKIIALDLAGARFYKGGF